jgi:hypothetical protein
MNLTIVKMSYLIAGNFVSLNVKCNQDGTVFDLFIDGSKIDSFSSAQLAVRYGMEYCENMGGE